MEEITISSQEHLGKHQLWLDEGVSVKLTAEASHM